MKRLALFALLALAACDKPTPEACKAAILHMQQLLGLPPNASDETAVANEVRRCRGGSSKASVECATKAKTLDDLKKCEFFKVTDKLDTTPTPAGSGSAGSAGSSS
jgi:hypothetical protein